MAADMVKKWDHNEPLQGFKVYGIPRGGVPVALMLTHYLNCTIADKPEDADVFVDDIVDSGHTKGKFATLYPNKPFYALIDKLNNAKHSELGWVVFPWEKEEDKLNDDSIVGTITNRLKDIGASFKANDNISVHLNAGEMEELEKEVARRSQKLLEALIIDTANCHNSRETASRMAKMYCREIFAGRYQYSPAITTFPNTKELDEVYTVGPITVRSTCSHHLCPVVGKCWIGVIPDKKLIGLSKFNRLVDWVASRAQIQEEMIIQIADLLEQHIAPKGLAVVIEATHSCMTIRGVKESHEATMSTSVMRGAFREKPEARAEFFSLIKK